MSDTLKPVMTQHIDAAFELTIEELSELARIPSVSWPGFDPAHVQASAENPERGQPAIITCREAKDGAPIVLLYAHHDVQPPWRDEDWETGLFEPTRIGERLFARGDGREIRPLHRQYGDRRI